MSKEQYQQIPETEQFNRKQRLEEAKKMYLRDLGGLSVEDFEWILSKAKEDREEIVSEENLGEDSKSKLLAQADFKVEVYESLLEDMKKL